MVERGACAVRSDSISEYIRGWNDIHDDEAKPGAKNGGQNNRQNGGQVDVKFMVQP